jgi:CelD/BcsL family acetyltransferase involved in cellulose biosynthesis
MLKEVGPRLLSAGRFHLWRLEIQGVTISAQLFVSAGDHTSYWLGGFDEAWGRHSPGLLTILVAIEDASTRGTRCLDLGPGAQPYKYRLADREEMSRSVLLVPAGPRAPLLRAGVGTLTAVRTVFHRLSPDAQDLVRRSLRVAQRVRARVTSA